MKKKKARIHVEDLLTRAKDWWFNRPESERETIIVDFYMKREGIKDTDISW
jgi:hypothetical protein